MDLPMPSKETKEKIIELVKNASKDEILAFVYELFIESDTEKEAKADLIYLIERLLSITKRYFEFRVRELTDRGLLFNYSYNVEKFWDGVRLTIDIRFGKDLVMDLAKWLAYIRQSRRTDAEIKKTLLKRSDFISEEVKEGAKEFESPKDRLVEEAEKIREQQAE